MTFRMTTKNSSCMDTSNQIFQIWREFSPSGWCETTEFLECGTEWGAQGRSVGWKSWKVRMVRCRKWGNFLWKLLIWREHWPSNASFSRLFRKVWKIPTRWTAKREFWNKAGIIWKITKFIRIFQVSHVAVVCAIDQATNNPTMTEWVTRWQQLPHTCCRTYYIVRRHCSHSEDNEERSISLVNEGVANNEKTAATSTSIQKQQWGSVCRYQPR